MDNIENDDWINHVHDDPINQHAHNVYHGFDTHFPTQSPTLTTYNNIIELNNSTSTSNINFPNNYLLYFVIIRILMNII